MFHLDSTPIDQGLFQSFVNYLSKRGPDAQDSWINHSIGLGHSLLRTTRESSRERQPMSLEGRYWIVADARLDGRMELLEDLLRASRKIPAGAPDCQLISHAYAVWGTSCTDHLKGDFSFAVWDAKYEHLFCARDHFGLKPFYYARIGDVFLFSNTLRCIQMHSGVSRELNEAAIGDFLLFGLNCDIATTTFRDIQRLPPAHSLTISREKLQTKRYWTPPTDGRVRYVRPEEYVEAFNALLESAVADRMRTDHIGVLLSGGLDSSSVAAVVKEISHKSCPATEVRAYTHTYQSLIPDRDGEYARKVGEFLRIPVTLMGMDRAEIFERHDNPQLIWPEPVDNPFLAAISEVFRRISADCRVVLSGEGSDNVMDFQMWPYVRDLRKRGEWQRLVTDVANYLWVRPFPWRGIRTRALRAVKRDPDQTILPNWLKSDFSRRANLAGRWKQQDEARKSWAMHPIHPRAHGSLTLPQWTNIFELEDPGATSYALETRYPFLDLRIVNFLLALPPFPWFFKKTILREAMTGRLPEDVRSRPKAPLAGDPVLAQLELNGTRIFTEMSWSQEIDRYIERSALKTPHVGMNREQLNVHLRPYALNIWLKFRPGVRYKGTN